jgi:hypothetical protein
MTPLSVSLVASDMGDRFFQNDNLPDAQPVPWVACAARLT